MDRFVSKPSSTKQETPPARTHFLRRRRGHAPHHFDLLEGHRRLTGRARATGIQGHTQSSHKLLTKTCSRMVSLGTPPHTSLIELALDALEAPPFSVARGI